MSTIESLMVTEMIAAAPDESVLKVADRMVRNRAGAVLVLDGAIRGRTAPLMACVPG